MMEGGLFIVTALLIGRLGEVPAAAHQIAINVASLCFMIPFGLAEATTVRVGHAIGSGRGAHGVRRAAFAGGVLALGTQLLGGSILLFGHDGIVALYTRDAAVATLASSLLLYAAAFQFPDGIQVVSAGALRGLKDTRVPMLLAACAYWGIGMPLGAGPRPGPRLGAARHVDRPDRRADRRVGPAGDALPALVARQPGGHSDRWRMKTRRAAGYAAASAGDPL